jgi:hypothetical protein
MFKSLSESGCLPLTFCLTTFFAVPAKEVGGPDALEAVLEDACAAEAEGVAWMAVVLMF